ncbi:DNA polymerase [Ammonifex thiophilus]|uniref:DNA polymerase I n=1 Tax=Ammonifex thiophilus TaxID=444093 RepID=A0A3D8P3H4_9THEO|nr:DNA polymerase [Ammonifex thiophilus]RDV81693.1 hypothetical protein DXX99_09255 [Ammonifex thiophilus]
MSLLLKKYLEVQQRGEGEEAPVVPQPPATPGSDGDACSSTYHLAAAFLKELEKQCSAGAPVRAWGADPGALACFFALVAEALRAALGCGAGGEEEVRLLLAAACGAWEGATGRPLPLPFRPAGGEGAAGPAAAARQREETGGGAANADAGGDSREGGDGSMRRPGEQLTLFGGCGPGDPGVPGMSSPFRSPWQDWLDNAEIKLLTDLTSWEKAVEEARGAGVCGLDLETTGLDPLQARIRLVQLAVPVYAGEKKRLVAGDWRSPEPGSSARAYVLDLFALPEPDRREALELLAGLVADPGVVKVGHNLAFDLAFLRAALGRRLSVERLFDTMLASQLCNAGDFVPGGRWEKWVEENGYRFATNDRGQELKSVLLDGHGHRVAFESDHQKEVRPFYPTHSLQQVAHRHLEVWLDKRYQASDWAGELSEEQVRYAAWDAAVVLPLREVLRELLVRNKLVRVAEVEFACVPATVEVELSGMPFDAGRAGELLAQAEGEVARCRSELEELARGVGFVPPPKKNRKPSPAFNPDSSADCVEFLRLLARGEDCLSSREKRGGGVEEFLVVGGEVFPLETRDDTLRRVAARLPEGSRLRRFAELLREYRAWKKRADFLGRWLSRLHPATGRLHPDLRQLNPQCVGRFSASGANLQQVPRGSEFRALFRAPEGRVLVLADFSNIEMRAAAAISGDGVLLDAFRRGLDAHRFTASFISGKPIEEVTKEERQMAKALNFGLIYGMQGETLRTYAETGYGVVLSPGEAEEVRRKFFELYRGVDRWHGEMKRRCRDEGEFIKFWQHDYRRGFYWEGRPYVRTRLGRLRVWPVVEDGNGGKRKAGALTEALNTPVQGSAADLLKLSMVRLYRELLRRGWEDVWMTATVHDELHLECPENLAEGAKELLVSCMEGAGRELFPEVPVVAEAVVARDWGEKA